MSSPTLRRLIPTTLFLALAGAMHAHAQPSPLLQIPAKTPIVVQLRGYERSLDRLKAVLKAALPDFSGLLIGQIDAGLADILRDREVKGLAKDGPIFLLFTEVPTGDEEQPEAVVVARVANYVQFRDSIMTDDEKKELKADKAGYEVTKFGDRKTYMLNRGDYAIVTASDKALKLFLAKKIEPLSDHLAPVVAAKLLETDLSVYVDMKAVRKQHGDKLDQAKEFLEQALQLAQGMGNVDKAQLDAAKKLYDGLFQLLTDTDAVVAGVDFRPEGILVRVHSQVGEKSKTNEFLKTTKPTALSGLAKLPSGQLVYTTSTPNQDVFQGFGMSMFLGVGGGADAKENKAMTEAIAELVALKAEATYSSTDFPAAGIQVTEYADAAKAVAATLKMYQAVPENAAFAGTALKGKPAIKTDAQKTKGFTLHSVQLTWDIDKIVERFPEELRDKMKELMKSILGANSRVWFGANGKTFVQITAKDWESAAKMLDSYLEGKSVLAKEAGYDITRKQLPAETNALVLLDAGRLAYAIAQYVVEILKNVPNFPGNLGELKKPEGKPSYIGIAITMQPQHGSFDLFVPAEAIKQIVGVLAPLFGGFAGD